MTWWKRFAAPVVVALLVAPLVGGPALGAGRARQTVVAQIMIPAAAFVPADNDYGYWSSPDSNRLMGIGIFRAPINFPVPVVSVRSITLYAHDGSAVMSICAHLYRSSPASGQFVDMGYTCTAGGVTSDPQMTSTADLSPRRVDTRLHGTFLVVDMYPNLSLYGVRVTYAYETGA